METLLNWKNKAVNKWIEEKEEHYDKLIEKLHCKAQKQIDKYQDKLDKGVNLSLNKESDTEESNRLSLQSSDTEKDSKCIMNKFNSC